jgi:hypothetical protein
MAVTSPRVWPCPGIPSGGFISRTRISRLKLLPDRPSFLRAIRSPDGRFNRTRSRLLCPSWHRKPSRRSSASVGTAAPGCPSRAQLGSCRRSGQLRIRRSPDNSPCRANRAPRAQLPKEFARNLSVETGLAPSHSAPEAAPSRAPSGRKHIFGQIWLYFETLRP